MLRPFRVIVLASGAAMMLLAAACSSSGGGSDVLDDAEAGDCFYRDESAEPLPEWQDADCDDDSGGVYEVTSTTEDTESEACESDPDMDVAGATGTIDDPDLIVCLRRLAQVDECVATGGPGHQGFIDCDRGEGLRVTSVHDDTVDESACEDDEETRVYEAAQSVVCLTQHS